MSTNIIDILVNEVATVLGITPDEVRSKFTKEQLDELLNNSLCDPIDEICPAIDSLEVPCDDTGTPLDLPPISDDDLNSFDNLINDAEKASENNGKSVKKCVDVVDKVNSEVQKQIDEYTDYNTLLSKLKEFRDNYAPIAIYFDERIKEANKLLFVFQPLIQQLRDYEFRLTSDQLSINDLNKKIDDIKKQAGTAGLTQAQQNTIKSYKDSIKSYQDDIQTTTKLIVDQKEKINNEELKYPIFSNSFFSQAISALGSTTESYYLNQFLLNAVSQTTLNGFNSDLQNYAEGLSTYVRTNSSKVQLTFQEILNQPIIKFSVDVPKINYIPTQKERYNTNTGNRSIENINFPIRTSPLLNVRTFFQDDNQNVRVGELDVPSYRDPYGKIYTDYYNLFKDPVNNFFSIGERGLTDNPNLIDPKLRSNPGAAEKRENGKQYWVSDLDTMSNFYQDFDAKFKARTEQRHVEVVTTAQNDIRVRLNPIAKIDVINLLALGGVNKFLTTEKQGKILKTIVSKLEDDYNKFVGRLNQLDREILRIKARVEELKPTPDKIKARLKQISPDCFGNIDTQVADCGDTTSILGSDPFFTKTINGIDPTLPNFTQLCYWKEFAKSATLMGLLPIPNIPNFTELRYWPVGLIIPNPTGIIKIPLPIIWLPLVAISTPLGVFVLFLTINGLFISPVVLFVSSKGFKQFIITIRGSSKKFGYDSEDQSIKPTIQLPIAALAAKEKAQRLINEASNGKTFNLTPKELSSYTRNKSILDKALASAQAKGNPDKIKRIKKEQANLDKSISAFGKFEKLQEMLNVNLDTADNAIDDVKRAINQRLNDLGRPVLSKVNELKSKITSRRDVLYKNLISALENNNIDGANKIREQLITDGTSYSDKVSALKKDAASYFDKIKLPKITIPKDRSKLDPKKNAIVEFLIMIKEYASIYKTQFVPKEHLVIKTWLSTNLAKVKSELKTDGSAITGVGEKLDIDKDIEKIKSYLLSVNDKVVKAASGVGEKVNYSAQKEEIANLEKQANSESDPIKKRALNKKVVSAKNKLSNAFENEFIQQTFAITPAVITALNGIKVNFNPFSPCCKKKPFSLDLSQIAPALIIIESASAILASEITGLTSTKVKGLVGGKNKVTVNEVLTMYLSIINSKIPTSLKIPNPSLSLVTFATTFSGIFLSLIEPKAPILVMQPAPPLSITIDLNILKPVLTVLLLKYIDSILPDGPSASSLSSGQNPNSNQTNDSKSNLNSFSIQNNASNSPNSTVVPKDKVKIDPSIEIVDCYREGEELLLNSPNVSDSNQASLDAVNDITKGKEVTHKLPNVIINSNKDVFIQFQHIDSDLLSINPNDILAIITTFIEAKLDDLKNILDPFYKLMAVARAAKGQNLNLIEFAQFKVPPFGPVAEGIFSAVTVAKSRAPKSAVSFAIDTNIAKDLATKLETVLKPIAETPLPYLAVARAGALDSILPSIKTLSVDPATQSVSTKDLKAATLALRSIHPMLNQDDLPPWERLTMKNLLFIIFLDEFLANAADQVGFFRGYV